MKAEDSQNKDSSSIQNKGIENNIVKKKVKKKKCKNCKKKIKTIPMKCKCNLEFCFKCYYPEKHNCTFDRREFYKKKLEKENPLINFSKLEKI